MYKIIWQYRVNAEHINKFMELYGPNGEWDKLFGKSRDFQGTELLNQEGSDNIFITIDNWNSKEAYDAFIKDNRTDYNNIDQIGDAYTNSEKLIGLYHD